MSTADDGHSWFNPSATNLNNIIKLRLACDTTSSPAVAGLLNTNCVVTTQHWIQVNVYTYNKLITTFNKVTSTLCKCNRPRPNAYRGITYSGATSTSYSNPNQDGQDRDYAYTGGTSPETGVHKGKNGGNYYWFGSGTDQSYSALSGDPCVEVAGFAKCKANYGLGTSGCSGKSPARGKLL